MKMKISNLLFAVLFTGSSLNLFAQDADDRFEINVDCPVFGNWIIPEGAKVDGNLLMVVNFDGNNTVFNFGIKETVKIGESVYFKCDNDKYYYTKKNKCYPFVEDVTSLSYQNSNDAIEAYKIEESKDIAWTIWILQDLENEVEDYESNPEPSTK